MNKEIKFMDDLKEVFTRDIRPRWALLLFGIPALMIATQVSESGGVLPTPRYHGTVRAAAATQVRRAIDGVYVRTDAAPAYPLAVVIENMIEARPTSGVARANLVWEAPTEAGITRFLAIYADESAVNEIGPVRSARPYYVDWAEEVHALFAHVGGSPEALSLIPSRAVLDLNEFANGRYFWRSNGRSRPHNVYTSTKLLTEALADQKKNRPPAYGVWRYKEDAPAISRPATQEFLVSFSTPAYDVTWKYHRSRNEYVRYQEGKLYQDKDGAAVRAKNVVVMATEIKVLDSEGRRRITTVGGGPSRIFRDGQMLTGTWRRPRLADRTRFYDAQGNEISLNAGTTWIEVIADLTQGLRVPLPQ